MDAHRREILIACLRRVDRGDPVDSVLRDYPEDAGWLREHLIVSDTLKMADEPSAEKKSRARESLLSAVAGSAPPANVAIRLKFGFALAPTALMVLICLGLTAGVAAASGVNLRSVAGDVVDSLVEPLPLAAPPPISAEGPQDTIALDSEGGAAGNDTAGGERTTLQPNDGGADEDDATLSDAPDDAASDNTNLPVEGGSSDETNRPGNKPDAESPPDDDPTADDPRDENEEGPHGAPSDETGPSPETPSPGGPPDGSGHDGSGGSGNHGDNAQPGGNGSNADGSSSGGPDGSNGNPSNSANGGPDASNGNPSNGPNGDPSNGSNGNPSSGPNGDPSNGSTGGGPNGSNGDASNGSNASGPDPSSGGSSDQCGGGPSASNPGDKGGSK